MNKTIAITLNCDFKRLYYKGKSIATPYVVLYYRRNNLPVNRLGITATKKIGCAVKRNRARRIVKQAYFELENDIKTGYDFVLVARGKTPYVKTSAVKTALEKCFAERSIKASEIEPDIS